MKNLISSNPAKAYVHGNSWHKQPRKGSTVATKARPHLTLEQADFISTILSHTSQFRGFLDSEGKFTNLNPHSLEFLGLSREEMQGLLVWQGWWWASEGDRTQVQTLTEHALLGKPSAGEFEVVGKTQRLWIEFSLEPIFNGLGNVVMILAEGNDITKRKRLEQALVESERQHRIVIEAMSEGVLQIEQDGTVSMCNAAAERLLGLSREHVLHLKPSGDWVIVNEDGNIIDIHDPTNPTATTFRTGEPQSNRVIGVRKLSGEVTWVLANTQPLKHVNDAAPHAVILTLTDITKRKQLEDQLRQMALYDALTGLPTRTLLMERLNQAVARHKRDAHTTFALLFIDLDNFKTVNDTLGHAAGDAVLIQVANKLKASLREADTVARLGGDEFLVLLEGLESEETAQVFAERVSSELIIFCPTKTDVIQVRASIGIAQHDGSTLTAHELLAKADKAMYKVKAENKGAVSS